MTAGRYKTRVGFLINARPKNIMLLPGLKPFAAASFMGLYHFLIKRYPNNPRASISEVKFLQTSAILI